MNKNKLVIFFATHRHIGHIELHKALIIKDLYIKLCVLCTSVFKKKTSIITMLFTSKATPPNTSPP
jgi:hypothetical protein